MPPRDAGRTAARSAMSGESVVVIIAAYNAERTLGSTLASLAGQSVIPGEVVVADDASIDATEKVARSWQDHLPIRVLQMSRNLGPGPARQEAVSVSERPLVAIVDADDIWLPDCLETLLALYAEQPGLVSARELVWLPGQRVVPGLESVPAPGRQLESLLAYNFASSSCLFSRRAYEEAGGFRSYFAAEDWDLWLRMVRNGVVINIPDHPVVLKRRSRTSLEADNGCLDGSIALFHQVLSEAAEDELGDARRTLRRLVAERHLVRSFESAVAGDVRRARWEALRSLSGKRRTRLRALAMLAAPRRAASWREEHRWDPDRWSR